MEKVDYFSRKDVDSDRVLYTPSSFARTSLLHLQEIGSLRALKRHTSRRQGLASYLFIIVEDGSGTLYYRGVEQRLSEGDCVFIDCNEAYAHETSEDLWKLKWAHFFGPQMGDIYKKYANLFAEYEFYLDLGKEVNPNFFSRKVSNVSGYAK